MDKNFELINQKEIQDGLCVFQWQVNAEGREVPAYCVNFEVHSEVDEQVLHQRGQLFKEEHFELECQKSELL